MTREEIKVESIKKEIEKITKSLDRYVGIFEKKNEMCIELGCDWEQTEMREKADSGEMTDKQWGAWFSRKVAQSNVDDANGRLENAYKRLAKAQEKLDGVLTVIEEVEKIESKEIDWIAAREKKEKEYQEWLKQFKAECLEDGIIIDTATRTDITGATKNGKRFTMELNNGFTIRSFYSYTLKINGETIFTSGLFSTGYRYLMHN